MIDLHDVTYFGQHLTKIIQIGCYSADRFITVIIIISTHSVPYSFPSLPLIISISQGYSRAERPSLHQGH